MQIQFFLIRDARYNLPKYALQYDARRQAEAPPHKQSPLLLPLRQAWQWQYAASVHRTADPASVFHTLPAVPDEGPAPLYLQSLPWELFGSSICKTGLANEEVVNGKCERCGSEVTKKNLRQWMLRITKYADRLLNDLDKLDWPEKVKKMQSDWIGKSYGAEVEFPVEGKDEKITVYTTRPDTLHGATFMVLAPEHAMAKELATDETREAVEQYIYDASMKSNVDRLQDKEKTGVFTGSYAINPTFSGKSS